MKIGIFFKVDKTFIVDAVPVASGESYGDAIQHGGHYDFHEAFIPAKSYEYRFKTRDYDYYPRGRVVFFPNRQSFVLYADPCLSSEQLQKVISQFDLEGQTLKIREDEHYRCASCNAVYL